jgi:addiction module HigA family antidote
MRTKLKSPTTTKAEKLPPVHPGEVLEEEFIKPNSLTSYRVAIDVGLAPARINEIVLRKRAITADTAWRLARYFGNSERFWMGLQAQYELALALDENQATYDAIERFSAKTAQLVQRPRSLGRHSPGRPIAAKVVKVRSGKSQRVK